MSVINANKQMTTELIAIENSSKQYIDHSKYYTVLYKLSPGHNVDLNTFSEICLCSTPQPTAVHFNNEECMLIFSIYQDAKQLSGDHHAIVSKYITTFAKHNPEFIDNVAVSIDEFVSTTDVIDYIKLHLKGTSIRLVQRKNKIIIEEMSDADDKTISKYIKFIFR